MEFIYCSNPINQTKPDDLYAAEFAVAKNLGMNVSLIDFEALVEGKDANRAIGKVAAHNENTTPAIYRGWMLSPSNYQLLYSALRNRGVELINNPLGYKHCHYLPEWYHLLESQTPASIWMSEKGLSEQPLNNTLEKLSAFGSNPVIVKDYVKSEKHRWAEACFIPDASDRTQAERVVQRFLDLRGNNLEGGLVFREFVNFKALAAHSKSGMPLTKEYRLFVLDGKIIHWFNYWEEGEYGNSAPPLDQFAEAAKKPKSRFFTMDIAQMFNDNWLIVELGDAQVAGLPESADVGAFYDALYAGLKSF